MFKNRNPKSKNCKIQIKSQFQNPNKDNKIYDIRERTFNFAKRILELGGKLPNNHVCRILSSQLVRAGTSIGANVEEADGTVTKRDLINKFVIARKETKETKYWIRLISSKYLPNEVVSSDLKEINEIINVLSAIINKLRK